MTKETIGERLARRVGGHEVTLHRLAAWNWRLTRQTAPDYETQKKQHG